MRFPNRYTPHANQCLVLQRADGTLIGGVLQFDTDTMEATLRSDWAACCQHACATQQNNVPCPHVTVADYKFCCPGPLRDLILVELTDLVALTVPPDLLAHIEAAS